VSTAVSVLTSSTSTSIEAMPSTVAKPIACRCDSVPVGSGRPRVRAMYASMRRSSTWLNAAAEPAASAMPMFPYSTASSGGSPGAASSVPTMAVNTISETTRGLVSST